MCSAGRGFSGYNAANRGQRRTVYFQCLSGKFEHRSLIELWLIEPVIEFPVNLEIKENDILEKVVEIVQKTHQKRIESINLIGSKEKVVSLL